MPFGKQDIEALREEARALNCPQVGDIWSEMCANWNYVCDVDRNEGIVRVLSVHGGGRDALLFTSIGDFQDWLMYSSAPVRNSIAGWTWCDFVRNDPEHHSWVKEWVEHVKEYGYKEK